MTCRRKKAWILYIAIHLGLLAAIGLILLWRALSIAAGVSGLYCPLHQLLHLYCPFCGGTRVISAIFQLDFRSALAANPIVLLLLPVFLLLDLRAFVRLLRGDVRALTLPSWLIPSVLAAFLLYGVARNILLILLKIDPLGDLSAYY